MSYETQRYIYNSIKIRFDGENVVITQWCRAGREVFEIETLGM